MTTSDQEKNVLAACFATATLSETEALEAEALMLSDPAFADLVRTYRELLAAEDDAPLPEAVWNSIERRLKGRQN